MEKSPEFRTENRVARDTIARSAGGSAGAVNSGRLLRGSSEACLGATTLASNDVVSGIPPRRETPGPRVREGLPFVKFFLNSLATPSQRNDSEEPNQAGLSMGITKESQRSESEDSYR